MWKHVLGSVLLWFGVTAMTVGLAGAGDRDPQVNVALGAATLPIAAALMLLFRRQIAQGRYVPPLNSLRKGVWFERIFAVLFASPVFVLTQANIQREDYYVVGGMLAGSVLVFWASSTTLRKPVLVRLLLDRDPAVRAKALATLDRAGWRPRDDRERAVEAVVRGRFEEAASLGHYAAEPLVMLLESATDKDMASALLALRHIGRPGVDALARALRSTSSHVRRSAIETLGLIQDEAGLEPLKERAAAPMEEPDVRRAAILALRPLAAGRTELATFLETQSRAIEEESRKREQAAGTEARRRADAEREERERKARQAQKDAEERKKTHGIDKEKVAAELGVLSALIYKMKVGTTLPTDRIVDLILEFQAMEEGELMELKDEDLALKKFLVKRGFVQDW